MIKELLTYGKFYRLVAIVIVILVVLGGLANYMILPAYTNYNEGVTVPDITKLSVTEAQKRLHAIGLRDSVVDRRYNAAFPANYVIDQTPSPALIVKPNRLIYLTVNSSNTPKVIVPDVTNMSLRNAELQLKNYGLTVGNVSYVAAPYKNTVIRQSVAEGTSVERGAIISLTVSDGYGIEKVPVPALEGLRLYEAQAALRNVGLRIGEIRFKGTNDIEPNIVMEYSPATADSLVEGTKINLVVSEQGSTQEETETGAVIVDSTEVETPSMSDTTNVNYENPKK